MGYRLQSSASYSAADSESGGEEQQRSFSSDVGYIWSFVYCRAFSCCRGACYHNDLFSSAQQIIQKTNPALNVSPSVAWILIVVSMLVVGPAEEYLFRGFVYGGMLNISKGKYWLPLAVVSSVMFAAAHGYYAETYQIVSPVFYIELITFGIAMAVAFYWSGGNIVALAVVHGLNDAIGFLGVATSKDYSLAAQGVFIAVCVGFAFVYVLRKKVIMKPEEVSGQHPSVEQPSDI